MANKAKIYANTLEKNRAICYSIRRAFLCRACSAAFYEITAAKIAQNATLTEKRGIQT